MHRFLPVLVLGLLVIAPLASADPGVYGTIVENADADRVVWYDLAFGAAQIAYEDIGSTPGAPDATDAFFIDVAGDNQVNLNDVVLTSQGGTVGSQVTSSNPHLGNTLITTNLPAALVITKDYAPVIAEGGPDGAFGLGDGMFVDVDSSGDVSAGDIVISSPNAAFGTRLTGASADATETVFDPATEAVCDGATKIAGGGADCTGARAASNVYFEDTSDDDVLDAGEDVYLATATTVAGGHYRVRSAALTAFTTVLCGNALKDADCGDTIEKLATAAITSATMSAAGLTGVVGHDADGTGDYTVGDGLYIDVDGDGYPSAGDIPLSGSGLTSGDIREVTDTDFVHALSAMPLGYQFIYSDVNVDGQLGATENVVIDADADTKVELADTRVTNHNSCALGSQRTATNTCDQTDWKILAGAAFGWTDSNNNGVLDIGDSIYLEHDGDTALEVNDIRVTAHQTKAAGSRITASDSSELTTALTALPAATLTFLDVDGSGSLTHGDKLYLDLDGNGFVSPGDVRMSNGNLGGAYGTYVDLDDADVVQVLTAVPGAGTLDTYDADGDGTDNQDPVYVFTGGAAGTVNARDVRISFGLESQSAAGTFVQASDVAAGGATEGATINFCFTDLVPDGAFGPGDGLYAHFGACGGAAVSVKDVRVILPGGISGTRVVASDDDANTGLSALPGTPVVLFYDVDSDGALGVNDRIYLNVDDVAEGASLFATPLISVSDVRLTGSGGATSPTAPVGTSSTTTTSTSTTSTVTVTQTTTATGTQTTSPSPTDTATDTDTDTGTETDTGTGNQQTPGFTMALALAAVAAGLVVARRRL